MSINRNPCDTCDGTGAARFATCPMCNHRAGVEKSVRFGVSVDCNCCTTIFPAPPCSNCCGTGIGLCMGQT